MSFEQPKFEEKISPERLEELKESRLGETELNSEDRIKEKAKEEVSPERLEELKESRLGETEPSSKDRIKEKEITQKTSKDILKEIKKIGVEEKPKESFEEMNKRFEDEVGKIRTSEGKELSLIGRNEKLRNLYLSELGYKIEDKKSSKGPLGKLKDFLKWEAVILDKKGNPIKDENNEIKAFKKSFQAKEKSPINDFLREELKYRIEKGLNKQDLTIKEATGFDELLKAVDKRGSIKYSTGESFSAEKIKKRVDDIREYFKENPDKIKLGVAAYEKSAGKFNVFRDLTRNEGLRNKVKELIEIEAKRVNKENKEKRKRKNKKK